MSVPWCIQNKPMLTKYTSDIFDVLRKGQFICSNSPNDHIQTLYKVLEDENTFEDLYEYFYQINYILEHGNEYFYFSRSEKMQTSTGNWKKLMAG